MKCTFFQLRLSWVATAKKKFQQLLPMIVTFFIWKNENRSLKCSREKKNNRRNNGDGKNILSMIIVFYTFEHWISTYNSRVHNVWLSSHNLSLEEIIQGLCWLETGFLFHKINKNRQVSPNVDFIWCVERCVQSSMKLAQISLQQIIKLPQTTEKISDWV